MAKKNISEGEGQLVTQSPELTLDDLCAECGLTYAEVTAYVSEGVIEPEGASQMEWRFSQTSVMITSKARRLERDLGLNPAGVALALQLMEQVESLKQRLVQFEENRSEKPG